MPLPFNWSHPLAPVNLWMSFLSPTSTELDPHRMHFPTAAILSWGQLQFSQLPQPALSIRQAIRLQLQENPRRRFINQSSRTRRSQYQTTMVPNGPMETELSP